MPQERMAFLRQDQFAYEDQRVLDVVMMGHEQMWNANQEKNAIRSWLSIETLPELGAKTPASTFM